MGVRSINLIRAGGGGGGRIAVYYQNSSFTGTMKAWGAGSGANFAGAGTIYTKVAGQSAGATLRNRICG